MILKILIIVIIIIIFYLIINNNIDYFTNNYRNSNEYPWERNDINSTIPYDIKLKNNKSNLYEYGNEEYEKKLKDIFNVSTNNTITAVESSEWSKWTKPDKSIKQYYNNIYKYIYNKINNNVLLKLPNDINNNIMINKDKLLRIKKNKDDFSYYMFDIEMVLYRDKKPLGKHCKFIVVSNNIEFYVIFIKIIGVITENDLINTTIKPNDLLCENNYSCFDPIKKVIPDMNSYIYDGTDKLLNSEIEYNIYKKLLDEPDISNIKIPDADKIDIITSNEEYTKNMVDVRNYFLSKLN